MSAYLEYVVEQLKKQGLRVTKPRRLVTKLLDTAKSPLSAYEIKDILDSQNEAVDIVSIYRILDCFEENHLVHRVLSSGKVVKCHLEGEDDCHLHQEDHCHHLLICDGCGHIDEIHCPEMMSLMKHLSSIKNFQITGHNLEFTGLCKTCA